MCHFSNVIKFIQIFFGELILNLTQNLLSETIIVTSHKSCIDSQNNHDRNLLFAFLIKQILKDFLAKRTKINNWSKNSLAIPSTYWEAFVHAKIPIAKIMQIWCMNFPITEEFVAAVDYFASKFKIQHPFAFDVVNNTCIYDKYLHQFESAYPYLEMDLLLDDTFMKSITMKNYHGILKQSSGDRVMTFTKLVQKTTKISVTLQMEREDHIRIQKKKTSSF